MKFIKQFTSKALAFIAGVIGVFLLFTIFAQAFALALYAIALMLVATAASYLLYRSDNDPSPTDSSESV